MKFSLRKGGYKSVTTRYLCRSDQYKEETAWLSSIKSTLIKIKSTLIKMCSF